ncbi:MAG: TRASH domain-containing protein [Candidatus Nanohaloarchaea archaeon]|nr:TRASH domain-containing protein [Candidatus Nanohaloarchaea archaeon]
MECDYCGSELEDSAGKMLVLNSGEKIYFCSGKCEKNWENNRSLEYKDKPNQ